MQDLIISVFQATIADFIDIDNPLFVQASLGLAILSPAVALVAGIVLH